MKEMQMPTIKKGTNQASVVKIELSYENNEYYVFFCSLVKSQLVMW